MARLSSRLSMNDEPYNIVGQKVALGPLKRELLGLYQRFMNDWPAAMWLGRTPMPITAEAELAWFERLVKSETDVAFTVYEKATGKPIGNAGLHGIQPINRNAEYGIALLEKECRGKGYGTETTRLVVDYGFRQLGLHNIHLTCFDAQEAGLKAYARVGFKVIGRWRNP